MSKRKHYGFGSTPTFHNLYKEVQKMTDNKARLEYANYDPSLGVDPTPEQIEKLQNYKCKMPVITFIGSEKLHGENMAVAYTDGEMWVQGRNHIRTVLGDQNGMAQFVEEHKDVLMEIFTELSDCYIIDLKNYTIVIDCEWAGGNIQRGNAACSGCDKAMYIFDYARVIDNDTEEVIEYIPMDGIMKPEHNIFNMKSFFRYEVTLDFNKPEECEETLRIMAENVENNSPIAMFFGKKDNVGEGIYFTAKYKDKLLRLKCKGLKHGGKPKTPKEPKSKLPKELRKKYNDIANELTPEWRLNQGIKEVEATETKDIGKLLKWVMQDIIKEEMPILEKHEVAFKDVQGFVVQIIKDYYFDSIKGF